MRAAPKSGTGLENESGGAYVSCWINFQIRDGAELLAKYYVEQTGWTPEAVEETNWVEKSDYEDDPENATYYAEAETDGASFVFDKWPVNGEDE